MKREFDVLNQKKKELNSYIQQYDRSVLSITGIITNLEEINKGIDDKVAEITEYEEKLQYEKIRFKDTKDKNAIVLKNLKALIGE